METNESAMTQDVLEPKLERAEYRPKVLIVDDNEELLEEMRKMFASGGYDVITTSDSYIALEEALHIKPDIIILDLKMSPKSGFHVAEEIRSCYELKDTPIIAMTGFYTEKEHVLMMKLCGIKSFILKPFQPADLIARVEFALGRQTEEYPTQDV